MVAPIVAAGLAVVAKYIVKNGFKMAMRKYGSKAAEKASDLAGKSRPFKYRKTKLKYGDLNPGSNLKTAVTESDPKGKRAARRKSYCARSLGQLKKSSAKTRNDPNSRIRQARRRWKC